MLGVNANEAVIRNLLLTVEDFAEFVGKAIATQQKSLKFSGHPCPR